MTKSEYQQLVEFIAPKFDEMREQYDALRREFGHRFDGVEARLDGHDDRFDGIDQRFDGIETRLTRVEINFEENRHLIEIVAEGVSGLRTEMHSGFSGLREEMRTGFQLHGNAIRDLDTRVTRLEELAG